MAIAFVKSHGTNSNAASATTITIVPTSTIPVGNFLLLGVGSATSGTTITVADTQSNTYQVDQTQSTTARVCHVASAKITTQLTTSDTVTVTYNASRTLRLVALDEFSGLHTTTWKGNSDSGTGTSTAPTSPGTVTTTVSNQMAYGACVFGNAGAAYAPGSTNSINYNETNEVKLAADNGLQTEYVLGLPNGANPSANGTITNAAWTQVMSLYLPAAAAAAATAGLLPIL